MEKWVKQFQNPERRRILIGWGVKRLAMMIFDILAVNASYIFALFIRFYVNNQFRPIANNQYIPAYVTFAPYYTVICIAIFILFRLYNSKWKYAGLNDLNQIFFANLTTCAVHILGTLLFVKRMPITYYAIGAFVQFFLIALSRFSWQILKTEKSRLSFLGKKASPVTLVGVGNTAMMIRRRIEHDPDHAAKLTCIFNPRDHHAYGSMDGVPYLGGLENLQACLKQYPPESVLLADPLLSAEEKTEIRKACEEKHIEVHDFAGYFNNEGGNLTLKNLMARVNGPVQVLLDGKVRSFPNGEAVLQSLTDAYEIESVSVRNGSLEIAVSTGTTGMKETYENWVRDYEKINGEAVSFF